MNQREKAIFRVTFIGSIVNVALVLLKLISGIWGRSSALVADGVHSLTDFITDVIVLVFVKLSGKPRDKVHSYGHGKFETLATLIIGVFLTVAGIGLMVSGVRKSYRVLMERCCQSLHGLHLRWPPHPLSSRKSYTAIP